MKTIIALFALLAAAAYCADEKPWVAPARAAARKNPVAVNETSLALGKAVYERECIDCHGATGSGSGRLAKKLEKRPGDLSSPKMWEQTDGALLWKVSEGHDPMPAFKNTTSDQERWPVINYIRSLAPKPGDPEQRKGKTKP